MIGPGKRVLKTGAVVVGRAVTEANLAVTSLPGGNAVPIRRTGFGLALFLDARGSSLLDFLGDDHEERADTLDRFLSKCSDDEINELFAAFQEAVVRRGRR